MSIEGTGSYPSEQPQWPAFITPQYFNYTLRRRVADKPLEQSADRFREDLMGDAKGQEIKYLMYESQDRSFTHLDFHIPYTEGQSGLVNLNDLTPELLESAEISVYLVYLEALYSTVYESTRVYRLKTSIGTFYIFSSYYAPV